MNLSAEPASAFPSSLPQGGRGAIPPALNAPSATCSSHVRRSDPDQDLASSGTSTATAVFGLDPAGNLVPAARARTGLAPSDVRRPERGSGD